jgi:hypothetical protein
MTTPDDIQADISGVAPPEAPNAGDPQPWRLVKARWPRNIGDIVNDPNRGPWTSNHNGKPYQGTFDAYEQQVCVAEQLAWTHKFSDGIVRDPGDILIELMEFVIAWRATQAPPPVKAPAPDAGRKRRW